MIFDIRIHQHDTVYQELNHVLHKYGENEILPETPSKDRVIRGWICLGARAVSIEIYPGLSLDFLVSWAGNIRLDNRYHRLRLYQNKTGQAWTCWVKMVDDGRP